MKTRILRTYLALTALTIVAFGIPLGAIASRFIRQDALLSLERTASAAGLQVALPLGADGDPPDLPEPTGNETLTLYDGDGHRVFGPGPAVGDAVVTAARQGSVADGIVGDEVVVAVPLAAGEQVAAVTRAALPRQRVTHRVRQVWALIAAIGLFVAGLVGLLAAAVASRLTSPVRALTDATTRLGTGDFAIVAQRSGVPEVDAAAEALATTANRVRRLLERERTFSADAAHQLRTPVAALRLHLETMATTGTPGPHLGRALADVDRLETTLQELLGLIRDPSTPRARIDLSPVLEVAVDHWRGPLAAQGRHLDVRLDAAPDAVVSAGAIRQVLDVLLDNATEHGVGTVTLASWSVGPGLALEVADEGRGLPSDEHLFDRTPRANGRGIGLALARSLAEAEGARLIVDPSPPTRFRLLLPTSTADPPPDPGTGP